MRRFILLLSAALLLPLTAHANWKTTTDGAAIIENGGNSALSLRCDNNSNTGNTPKWQVRVDALNLRDLSPQVEMVFRFSGRTPLRMTGDNNNGFVSIDGMNAPTQGDIQTLIRALKSSSRVTVALIDGTSGTAMDPLAFSLRGSSRAITTVATACRGPM